MRTLATIKRHLIQGWGINISIGFALLTLCLLIKNYIAAINESRELRSAVDEREAMRTLEMTAQVDASGTIDNMTLPADGTEIKSSRDEKDVGSFDSHGSNSSTDSSESERIDPSAPPFIIVMGQWRFGSSIVGQIFNQNPGIFFLFEPLWIVDELRKDGKLPPSFFSKEVHDYSTDFLRGMATCSFSEEYSRITNRWPGLIGNRAVCEKVTSCRFPSARWLTDFCRKFKGLIATKLIRANLDNIKPLVVDDRVNVKIVHLVRDPRGAAASRIHYLEEVERERVISPRSTKPLSTKSSRESRLARIGLNDYSKRPKDCIPTMCKWMRENVHTGDNIPEWLRNRYYLLKYEEFAESPVKFTEELYRFIGLPLPVRVRDWVIKNTLTDRSQHGMFDTQKNSRRTAKRWLFDLKQPDIEQVEADCLDVMTRLGYEPYANLTKTR